MKLLQIMTYILLLSSVIQTASTLKLKGLKSKAKNYFRKKVSKSKPWQFQGNALSEYPGTNTNYREINRQMWEEYYDCLKTANVKLVVPEAILAFEGGFVQLECKICLSPKEQHKIDVVEWRWGPIDGKKLAPIEYTEHTLLSPVEKTLNIYNLQEQHSGQYLCQLGESRTAPYFLTVVNSSTPLSEVHTSLAKFGPYAYKSTNIPNFDIVIDTKWGSWSACSRCGATGKRHKLGYCILTLQTKFKRNTTEYKATTPSGGSSTENSKNKRSKENITTQDLELLKFFATGIPCQSHILSNSLRRSPEIQERRNEIMTGYCKIDCPEDKVFEVKDKDGNVLEKANNSAGIYSMLQGPPPVSPNIERRLQYEVLGEKVVLSCPGNLNSDAPIQWQIGSKNVIAELISQETQGRIYLSVMDKIHITKAKISDSNIYSCWQNRELAGTIRLVIEKKLKLNLNHHIMLFGIVIILGTFLYVFAKAFFGRKYARVMK